jgi:predicted O-methyltransferase YrrM
MVHSAVARITSEVNAALAVAVPAEVSALLEGADEWAISIGAGQYLHELVKRLKPRSVLEFGAGRSSLVIASALQQCGGGRLTSIEHEPSYVEASWQKMSQFPSVDATLVRAGLKMRLSTRGLWYEYAGIDRALASRGPFDLLFIDAPPGDRGRDATLLVAGPFLADGAVAVVDDANRPREQTAIRRWERTLGAERVFESEQVGRGIAVIRIPHARPPAFSWRTFVGSIHDRVSY